MQWFLTLYILFILERCGNGGEWSDSKLLDGQWEAWWQMNWNGWRIFEKMKWNVTHWTVIQVTICYQVSVVIIILSQLSVRSYYFMKDVGTRSDSRTGKTFGLLQGLGKGFSTVLQENGLHLCMISQNDQIPCILPWESNWFHCGLSPFTLSVQPLLLSNTIQSIALRTVKTLYQSAFLVS